jgi:nitrite reductase/ring-hydroxylating ferredoxin subunit/uncharacterized membrane protein
MQKLVRFVEKQKSLDRVTGFLKATTDDVLGHVRDRKKVEDALNGVWLGHPLHPLLTDIPVGAWTTAAIFDLAAFAMGRRSRAGTGAIAVGIAGAIPTAATGVMDWYNLNERQQRIGSGHALLNSAALACYVASLLTRLSHLGSGRRLSFIGLGLVTVSAYLGGHLVYSTRAGVKRASEEESGESFALAGRLGDLAEGSLKRVDAGGAPVLMARAGGQTYAVADTCTHLACSLAEGHIEGDNVVCSCHGSRFSLKDGSVVNGPATQPLTTYDVRLHDGLLEVRAQATVS